MPDIQTKTSIQRNNAETGRITLLEIISENFIGKKVSLHRTFSYIDTFLTFDFIVTPHIHYHVNIYHETNEIIKNEQQHQNFRMVRET